MNAGRAIRRDSGTTVVELMVTLAVMSIAMAIIAAMLIVVQRSTNQIENSSTAIDSARLMSATLDRELRSAVCITSPEETKSGNVLTFQTIASDRVVVLTYTVIAGAMVTRSQDLSAARTVVEGVGSTTTAFKQLNTPLRTIVVDIPIQSVNGGEFHLQTTIAGRNAWHRC
jgi:type II secretory pathway component PulJ